MEKGEIADIAQLLTAIKDTLPKLEEAIKLKDDSQLTAAKREILIFQRKLAEIL